VGVVVLDLLWHSICFDLQILCDHLPNFRSGANCQLFIWSSQGNFHDSTGNSLHVAWIAQPALSPRPADQLQIPLNHPNWLIFAQHGPFPVVCLKIHVVDRLKKSLETHFYRSEPCAPRPGVLGVPFDLGKHWPFALFLRHFVAFLPCIPHVFALFYAVFRPVLGSF
jgi:hypothetical protein